MRSPRRAASQHQPHMASPQHDMAPPPRSPAIPDEMQMILEKRITLGLFVALSKLHDELNGNTEAPLKQMPYNKNPKLSWGRQSPQLTPTPSPSPSPKISHHNLQSLPTPLDLASPTKPAAAPRRSRHKRSSRTPPQSSHIMIRRSGVRKSLAPVRQFWELDASGRRAKRIASG